MTNEKLPYYKFILIDADTNEEKGQVYMRLVPKYDGKMFEPIFTDEQEKVKNKRIEWRIQEFEITQPVVNNDRIPVEHVRPPKPTKKWSKRHY